MAYPSFIGTFCMLNAEDTAPTTSLTCPSVQYPGRKSMQATVTGTGAVTATVVFEVSNDNVNWIVEPIATITLSGTTTDSQGFTMNAPWAYVRARLTAISGTGAVVTVTASA